MLHISREAANYNCIVVVLPVSNRAFETSTLTFISERWCCRATRRLIFLLNFYRSGYWYLSWLSTIISHIVTTGRNGEETSDRYNVMTNEATAMGGYLRTLTQVEGPLIPFLKYVLFYSSRRSGNKPGWHWGANTG